VDECLYIDLLSHFYQLQLATWISYDICCTTLRDTKLIRFLYASLVKKTVRFGFHAISQYFSFDFGAQRLNLSFFQTIIFHFFSLELISQNKILVLSVCLEQLFSFLLNTFCILVF